jgi:hypothetical protein
VTPHRATVRIQGRCRIHARCYIDRIFINHHSRGRDNDRPANDDRLGDDRSRLRDNDRRRRSVLVGVSFPLIAWNIAVRSYRQIGGRCPGGRANALAAPKIALGMYIVPSLVPLFVARHGNAEMSPLGS